MLEGLAKPSPAPRSPSVMARALNESLRSFHTGLVHAGSKGIGADEQQARAISAADGEEEEVRWGCEGERDGGRGGKTGRGDDRWRGRGRGGGRGRKREAGRGDIMEGDLEGAGCVERGREW